MKNLIFGLAGLFTTSLLPAQIGIGQWETFQAYGYGTSVAIAGTKVYCGTQQGLYSYDYNSTELDEYTKPMGYVGLGVTAVGYSSKTNATIVAYDDANLDIIKPNEIVNLPQIKNYSLTGDKKIYNITISGDSAILSCGFGVVVVDMRQEIIKTDVKFSDDIGFAGEVCYDAAIMNGYYYFATSQGMYKVLYNSNIKDLSNWQLLSGLPTGKFNNVVNHNNTLYFNYSNYLTSTIDNSDTLYSSDGTTHAVYQPGWAIRVVDIVSNNGSMAILDPEEARVMDLSGSTTYAIAPGCFTRAERIDIDATNKVWIAHVGNGLLSYYPPGPCIPFPKDGPFSKNVWDMQFMNGDIWVAAGGVNIGDGNVYITDKMYHRKDGDWKWCNIPDYGNGDPVDIHCLAVEPNNPGHVFGGAWGTGLYEVVNFIPNAQYLLPYVDSVVSLTNLKYRIGGMAYDSDGNLWFTNSQIAAGQLKRKLATGTFGTPITLSGVNATNVVGKVAVDDRDQIWVAVHGLGIVVVKNDGTSSQRILTSAYNQGDLPQLSVRAMECDKDGQMWVGTHDGIRVFSPSQVFGSTNINGQKIVIKDENGINELLLKETIINDIEADGANRKWIATMGTGVRLVSDDGRDIIYSFTAENSPLLSNNVNCIAINDEDGEVCFGTDKGICCFRAEATGSTETFGNVYAYPNPVRPGYDGPIAIKGMATDANVKITDIAGNIVFETIAEGGQAVWNGKRYDGKRPSTGVYLVFAVNEDASQTVVTKILFIN